MQTEADNDLYNICLPKSFTNGRLQKVFSCLGSRKSINLMEYASIFYKFHLIDAVQPHFIQPIIRFFELVSDLNVNEISIDKVNQIEQDMIECICENEGAFPHSESLFIMHECIHICHYIKLIGPIKSFWMFGYERFNKFLKQLNHSTKWAQANIIKNYEVISYFIY